MNRPVFLKTYIDYFSDLTKKRTEQVILGVAIFSYLIHLLLIFLVNKAYLQLDGLFFFRIIFQLYTHHFLSF